MDKVNPTSIPTTDGTYAQIIDDHYFGFDTLGNTQKLSDFSTEFWVATAQFITTKSSHNNAPSNHNHHLQKHAVRQLLDSLITNISKHPVNSYLADNPLHQFLNDSHTKQDTGFIEHHKLWLDESVFPYRLQPTGYYISFSHSKNAVACAISKHKPIGIDLELNSVPLKIAQRFYSNPEKDWIANLDSTCQQRATDLLWMLKEATIKKYSSSSYNSTLMSGLKQNLLCPAQQIFNQLTCTQVDLIQAQHIENSAAATDKHSLLTQNNDLLYIHIPGRHVVITI